MKDRALPAGLALFLWILLFSSCQTGSGSIQIKTDTPRDTLETARWYFKKAKYKKAVEYYDIVLTTYIEHTQESSWALYEKSYCFYKMRKYQLAVKGFRDVKRLYPEEMGPVSLADKMIATIELKKGYAKKESPR